MRFLSWTPHGSVKVDIFPYIEMCTSTQLVSRTGDKIKIILSEGVHQEREGSKIALTEAVAFTLIDLH